jgi:hypothetical protein
MRIGNPTWADLAPVTQAALQSVIDRAHASGQRVEEPFGIGAVYAYPHPDGIAWGYDAPINIARGIRDMATGRDIDAEA